MIEDLKPYPEYKDSGLPWLGEVPAHWGIERAKRLFIKMNRPSQPGDDVVTCFRDGTVTLRKNRRTSGYTEAIFEHGYQGVRRGDLVISGMDAFAGAIGVSSSDGKSSPVYSVCLPQEEVNSHYYAYLLRRMAHSEWILALAKGIRERSTDFRFDVLGAQRLPLPSVSEQAAIARFLAWATNRLDRAIGAKRRIITLLQEQKQAIIHRAVTRGLDPSVPLKDSGIPWLGEIPEHWEVTRVKSEFECLNFRRIPLSTTERGKMKLRQYDYYGASGIIDKVDEYIFDDDLILIAEDGANLVNRNLPLAIIARGKYWVNNHAHILMPRKGSLEYLAALLECMDYHPWISGAAQPKLTQDRLMSIRIALPPPEEQSRIVEAFNKESAPIELSIRELLQEVNLLREYRTRLIADVVTGKLDVREAAAGLPEPHNANDEQLEPEEEEPEFVAEDAQNVSMD